jgi:hypothetical protein
MFFFSSKGRLHVKQIAFFLQPFFNGIHSKVFRFKIFIHLMIQSKGKNIFLFGSGSY